MTNRFGKQAEDKNASDDEKYPDDGGNIQRLTERHPGYQRNQGDAGTGPNGINHSHRDCFENKG